MGDPVDRKHIALTHPFEGPDRRPREAGGHGRVPAGGEQCGQRDRAVYDAQAVVDARGEGQAVERRLDLPVATTRIAG
jgi:hypothetical protein